MFCENARTAGRANAGRVDSVFNSNWQPVKRTDFLSRYQFGFSLTSAIDCIVRDCNDGVKRRIVLLDPTQVGLDDFNGRDGARTNQRNQFDGRFSCQLVSQKLAPFCEMAPEEPNIYNSTANICNRAPEAECDSTSGSALASGFLCVSGFVFEAEDAKSA